MICALDFILHRRNDATGPNAHKSDDLGRAHHHSMLACSHAAGARRRPGRKRAVHSHAAACSQPARERPRAPAYLIGACSACIMLTLTRDRN